MATKNKANEITLIRTYDAPVKTVWEAWTDPAQVAQWWGPRGFTLTTHSKDLKVGGHWAYTMHGPDGVNYPNKTIYYEVEKHKRLVYDHGGNDDQPPLFRVTVLFTETKNKTHMHMTMAFSTPEVAQESKKFIKKAGGNATWDRLAEYLEEKTSGKTKFVINRTFDAPIELIFDVWTDAKHIARWLSPTGTEMKFFKADIKPGGSSFYMMHGQDMKLHGKINYLKIERPHRIIYTQQFCDENETTTRHPMAPIWPETMLTIVEFSPESSTQTRITITWEPYGDFTSEEQSFFANARSGMTMGWTGSFDKLEDYLSHYKITT
jgi:uncharacterized protein YndB with AHSA1/START domain